MIFLLIQLHLCFLELLRFAFVLLPEFFQLGVQPLHSGGIQLLLVRNRKQNQFRNDGEQQNRQRIVVHQVIDQTHDPAKRLTTQII